MQVGRLLLSKLVLHVGGVFDKPDLFRGAPRVVFFHRHGQRLGQEPEGNSGHEGDDAGDDVAQPPGPDPAGVVRGDGHSLCGETRALLAQAAGCSFLEKSCVFETFYGFLILPHI